MIFKIVCNVISSDVNPCFEKYLVQSAGYISVPMLKILVLYVTSFAY